MSGDKLSPLQKRILKILSSLEPEWTLTGGAALVGAHLKHRITKDVDLFWRDRPELGSIPSETRNRLVGAGLEAISLQTSSTFVRYRVTDGIEVCNVDLVAEPVPSLEPPLRITVGEALIAVDTPHEILVNKLCALLSRSELRDLMDVQALLDHGLDLDSALKDAPKKDGGFSPLTLAWVLQRLNPAALAPAAGFTQEEAAGLERFRNELAQRLLKSSAP